MKQNANQPTRQIRKIIFALLLSITLMGNAGKASVCRTNEVTISQTGAIS